MSVARRWCFGLTLLSLAVFAYTGDPTDKVAGAIFGAAYWIIYGIERAALAALKAMAEAMISIKTLT